MTNLEWVKNNFNRLELSNDDSFCEIAFISKTGKSCVECKGTCCSECQFRNIIRASCIYVIYKNRKRKDLSLYQKKGHGNQFFVKIDGKEESAIRIFAKAFLGLKPNQVCFLQGKLSLENIKIYSKQDLARKTGKMAKSIPVGLFINKKKVNEWISARDAAKDLYISNQTVCDYCNQKTKKPLYDLRWLV